MRCCGTPWCVLRWPFGWEEDLKSTVKPIPASDEDASGLIAH